MISNKNSKFLLPTIATIMILGSFSIFGSAHALTSITQCGATSSSDNEKMIVSTNLIGDVGNCITISHDNVTLDCRNNFLVNLGSSEFGVWVSGDNVTVKNCNIQGFTSTGIFVLGSFDSTITRNSTTDNGFQGILIGSGSNNKVTFNESSGNTSRGIGIVSTTMAKVQGNTVYDNSVGIEINNGDNNLIFANEVNDNIDRNIMLINDSDGNTIKKNTADDSGKIGIFISDAESKDNTFVGNTANDNSLTGFLDTTVGEGTAGTANTYTRNHCSGNTPNSSPLGLCS